MALRVRALLPMRLLQPLRETVAWVCSQLPLHRWWRRAPLTPAQAQTRFQLSLEGWCRLQERRVVQTLQLLEPQGPKRRPLQARLASRAIW